MSSSNRKCPLTVNRHEIVGGQQHLPTDGQLELPTDGHSATYRDWSAGYANALQPLTVRLVVATHCELNH